MSIYYFFAAALTCYLQILEDDKWNDTKCGWVKLNVSVSQKTFKWIQDKTLLCFWCLNVRAVLCGGYKQLGQVACQSSLNPAPHSDTLPAVNFSPRRLQPSCCSAERGEEVWHPGIFIFLSCRCVYCKTKSWHHVAERLKYVAKNTNFPVCSLIIIV